MKKSNSLFADDIILYLKDFKASMRRLLDLIHTFSKVARFKTSMQKPGAFLYTNTDLCCER
jgi:hypothetical protein